MGKEYSIEWCLSGMDSTKEEDWSTIERSSNLDEICQTFKELVQEEKHPMDLRMVETTQKVLCQVDGKELTLEQRLKRLDDFWILNG